MKYFKLASSYDVTPTTVRQWIRRGKLRSAKKNGRDWLIPSITRFNCILGGLTSDNRFRVSINNQEREKLELALISSAEVTVEEMKAIFVPDKAN